MTEPLTSDISLMTSGYRAAMDGCYIMESSDGQLGAMAFAGGLASGIAAYILKKHGPQAAFDLMTGIADDILDQSNKLAV